MTEQTPEDLRYTEAHEWVRILESGRVRVGITDHAQSQLGDVVFVQLPDVGAVFAAGDALGEVESTKSVSDIYAPVGGTVVEVNTALEGTPELINSSAYGEGWLLELEPTEDGAAAVAALLDAAGYRELTAGA
ncbi:glycine cleavage system protein GcvH [Pseudonocardia sp. WMMC193]|uniref:glycine cleavage system protein GcvH n=1 Tax=Pseudonocardia sp. WMMC193 TaxID=2911965 RepID=UPI001F01A12E|nr:glycine cleavage system protein GcvH [Pseudonocardia sp. WMMC193]MCF7548850.1 glycine cleavage system protein GcvH [Pseudonocardia sp. WMMC193]